MSDAPEKFDDIRREYYQAETELLVVGSDAVIQQVGALSSFYTKTNDNRFNRDANEVRRLVAKCAALCVPTALKNQIYPSTTLKR